MRAVVAILSSYQLISVNGYGEVAGTSSRSGGGVVGFVYRNGTFTYISYPNAARTYLYAINNSDQVFGNANTGCTNFLYDRNTTGYTCLDSVFPTNVNPSSMNDMGIFVGSWPSGGTCGTSCAGEAFAFH